MLIDSHCHLDFPELAPRLDEVLALMRDNQVVRALCINVQLENFPKVRALAEKHAQLYASVGVHPDYEGVEEPSVEQLVILASHRSILGIGETGLDYYRLKGDLEWQRERFRCHIRAAKESGKPLIVHTRSAAEDTLRIMQEEGIGGCGKRCHGHGLLHFLFGHRDLQECAGVKAGRAAGAS
jgi:TatD DNase family protein